MSKLISNSQKVISCLTTASLLSYLNKASTIYSKYFCYNVLDTIENNDLSFKSIDNSIQHYSYYQNESDNYIILVHDYFNTSCSLNAIIDYFINKKFNVVVYKYFIDKDAYTFGIKESININVLVNNIIKQNVNSRIYLYGVGFGANTLMMLLANFKCRNIKCCVSDNAHISLGKYLSTLIKKEFGNDNLLLNETIKKYIEYKLKIEFNQFDYYKYLLKNETQIIFATNKTNNRNAKYLYNKNYGFKKYFEYKDVEDINNILDVIYKYIITI